MDGFRGLCYRGRLFKQPRETMSQIELESRALVYVVSGEEFSEEILAGRVLSQSPAAGIELERGSTVSVVISKGPDVVAFPDLTGAESYDEAAELLGEAVWQSVELSLRRRELLLRERFRKRQTTTTTTGRFLVFPALSPCGGSSGYLVTWFFSVVVT